MLEPLFQQMPQHPGLAHYIIHAYDAPPLAPKALDAARRYASLAPAIPHALHMPSHTFTRVGYWKESIETNRRSAEAARKAGGAGEELHALDYQTYAYLQIAQDKAAKGVVDHATGMAGATGATGAAQPTPGAPPVGRIRLRLRPFPRAMRSSVAIGPRPQRWSCGLRNNTPYTEAMTHFARAIGAARSGNPAAASADIDSARRAPRQIEVDAGRVLVRAGRHSAPRARWRGRRLRRGRRMRRSPQLSAAADAEDVTDKAAVTPGPLAPARELLGYMLLEAGRHKEALAAFEATMKKEPNRFRGIYGAARAAELSGDRAKSRTYYQQLLEIAKEADTERPELVQARKMVG